MQNHFGAFYVDEFKPQFQRTMPIKSVQYDYSRPSILLFCFANEGFTVTSSMPTHGRLQFSAWANATLNILHK